MKNDSPGQTKVGVQLGQAPRTLLSHARKHHGISNSREVNHPERLPRLAKTTQRTGGWIIERLRVDRLQCPPRVAYFSLSNSSKIHIQRDFHSSLSLSATPHGQLSKIEAAESEETTRRSRLLARSSFTAPEEVQVD
jgi:hypothetical protein